MQHTRNGRFVSNNGMRYIVFDWGLMLAAEAGQMGVFETNGPSIALDLCMTGEKSRKAINFEMSALRRLKYWYYDTHQGHTKKYPVYVDKFMVPFYMYQGTGKGMKMVPYFTSIWDKDGSFIGKEKFFARINIRKSHLDSRFRSGVISGVSESLNGKSDGFIKVFRSGFEEMSQVIDSYLENPDILKWVSGFTDGFTGEFAKGLESLPYLNTKYNSIKDLAPSNADAWNDLKGKLTELEGVFPGFSSWKYAGKYTRDRYKINGLEVRSASLFIHTLEGLLSIKAKRTAGELITFKAWGYVQNTITNEVGKGWLSRERHEQFKAEELADLIQKETDSHKGTEKTE